MERERGALTWRERVYMYGGEYIDGEDYEEEYQICMDIESEIDRVREREIVGDRKRVNKEREKDSESIV